MRLRRPDPQALWPKSDAALWKTAHATFVREGRDGHWKFAQPVPETWDIQLAEIAFHIRPNAFKHTGVFPEQLPNWNWARSVIRQRIATTGGKGEPPSVLNLFGYTGGATLACAQAGARVCHVDASKPSVGWAKENARLSRLADAPIRWICDDAKAFVKRELRRGNRYDAIIMDPPAFGRGPDGSVWAIEKDFLPFIAECHALLSATPLFCIVNGYASGYSQLAYRYNLESLVQRYGGTLESGELTLREQASKRLLPCGIFARWVATPQP